MVSCNTEYRGRHSYDDMLRNDDVQSLDRMKQLYPLLPASTLLSQIKNLICPRGEEILDLISAAHWIATISLRTRSGLLSRSLSLLRRKRALATEGHI